MAFTAEQLEATAQLNRARASLGEALGQTQEISHSGLDIEHISASLAKAVQHIFAIQTGGLASPESPAHVVEAMNFLRDTLMMLQDVRSNAPEIERITSTVAHILALLYPVSKVLETLRETRQKETKSARQSKHGGRIAPPAFRARSADEAQPIELTRSRVAARPAPRPAREPSRTIAKERRRSPRRVIEVDIGIHSDTNFFTGFSQDISSGGLFIATYDIFSIGTELNVNFSLPGGPVLSLDGQVRWTREYNETTPDIEPGMGIQFEKLSSEDRHAINQFMATNPPIFYDDE